MTNILIAGVAVLDFVFQMQAFPDRPEKYRADDATIVGGGNAANAAVAIARLGGQALLAARLGDDPIADLIVDGLAEEGVNTDLVRRFPGKRSSFSSIYMDASGERQIMNFRDNTLSMDADWLASTLPNSLDATLADTRWPDGAYVAMKAAQDRGIPGVIDAEAPVHEAKAALEIASHIAFSEQGATDFTGLDEPEAAALAANQRLQGTVIVTAGERGVVHVEDDQAIWHPAHRITVVDTLAAGDVWHAAFTVALAERQGLDQAIHFASTAAAIKCSRAGGRDGAPTRGEIKDFLKDSFRATPNLPGRGA
ncbi:MAG: PfkB family carbohydrate kinase [Pseudomonadota bacterium]